MFLDALFHLILSCGSGPIQTEYIISYLKKVEIAFEHCSQLTSSHAEKLVNLYRYSKSAKVRMNCIKLLGKMPKKLIESAVN